MQEATTSTDGAWVLDLDELIEPENFDQDVWKKRSIYRVPTYLRKLDDEAYEPQFMSLGPYHYDKSHLRPMEKHKVRAVSHFVKVSEKPLKDYVMELEKVVQPLMDAYDNLDDEWMDKHKFIQLMIRDGCFLLEIMRTICDEGRRRYASNDPLFSENGLVRHLRAMTVDVLRIENQLPMLLFHVLMSVEQGTSMDESCGQVYRLFYCFFIKVESVFDVNLSNMDLDSNNCLNMLQVYRKVVIGNEPPPPHWGECYGGQSAQRLQQEAGVMFHRSDKDGIISSRFIDGILSLPRINILGHLTEPILLNLMASEYLDTGTEHIVSSYVVFMASLIRSKEDAEAIIGGGLIETDLESPESIARFITQLNKKTGFLIVFVLHHLTVPLNDHFKNKTEKWQRRFRQWLLSLKDSYFKNPWTFISLIAAVVLLGLSMAQTVYAGLSYRKG